VSPSFVSKCLGDICQHSGGNIVSIFRIEMFSRWVLTFCLYARSILKVQASFTA
jgi:hypothetical protein